MRYLDELSSDPHESHMESQIPCKTAYLPALQCQSQIRARADLRVRRSVTRLPEPQDRMFPHARNPEYATTAGLSTRARSSDANAFRTDDGGRMTLSPAFDPRALPARSPFWVGRGVGSPPPAQATPLQPGFTESVVFSGLIDEVRIYNRVLSAGEIGADMDAKVTP